MNGDPWSVARSLGERIAFLELERRAADKLAKAAIADNAAAAAEVTALLGPYRALVEALTGNAGTSSKVTLADALEAAQAALEAVSPPTLL